MHAAFDGDEVVGGAGAYTYDFSVPGGSLPCAGVTVVGVYSTHRRRGVLRSMMDAQLRDVHERGEPIAALWASEETIYGRFGYGLAAWCGEVKLPREWSSFARPLERRGPGALRDGGGGGRALPARLGGAAQAASRRVRAQARVVGDAHARIPPEQEGNPKRFVVIEVDGAVAGYAIYRIAPRVRGRSLERAHRSGRGDRDDAAGDGGALALSLRHRLVGDDHLRAAPARPPALPPAREPAPALLPQRRLALGAPRRRRRRALGARVRGRGQDRLRGARRRLSVERGTLGARERPRGADRGSRGHRARRRRARLGVSRRGFLRASCAMRCASRSSSRARSSGRTRCSRGARCPGAPRSSSIDPSFEGTCAASRFWVMAGAHSRVLPSAHLRVRRGTSGMRSASLQTSSTRRRLIGLSVAAVAVVAVLGSASPALRIAQPMRAFVAPQLVATAKAHPQKIFRVIVQGTKSERTVVAAIKRDVRGYGVGLGRTLGAVNGASAGVTGAQLLTLAKTNGVAAISLDRPVHLLGGISNNQQWPTAVDARQTWSSVTNGKLPTPPAIAVVDSGIQGRPDFDKAPGDRPDDDRHERHDELGRRRIRPRHVRRGHRRRQRARLRRSRAERAARLHRRDERPGHGPHERRDRGLRLDHRPQGQYNIGVANFSLHSTAPASIFWDPLDQAVEKLWFDGIVVVAAAGNYGVDGQPSDRRVRAGQRPVRDHGRRRRHGRLRLREERHGSAVVGVRLHVRRLRKARDRRAWPLHGRSGPRQLDAREDAPRRWSRPATCSSRARRSRRRSSPARRRTCSRSTPTGRRIRSRARSWCRRGRSLRAAAGSVGVGLVDAQGRRQLSVGRRTRTTRSNSSSSPIRTVARSRSSTRGMAGRLPSSIRPGTRRRGIGRVGLGGLGLGRLGLGCVGLGRLGIRCVGQRRVGFVVAGADARLERLGDRRRGARPPGVVRRRRRAR